MSAVCNSRSNRDIGQRSCGGIVVVRHGHCTIWQRHQINTGHTHGVLNGYICIGRYRPGSSLHHLYESKPRPCIHDDNARHGTISNKSERHGVVGQTNSTMRHKSVRRSQRCERSQPEEVSNAKEVSQQEVSHRLIFPGKLIGG